MTANPTTRDLLPAPEAAQLRKALVSFVASEPPLADPLPDAPSFDLIGILSGIGETAYSWDIAGNRMEWESNAGSVLGVRSAGDIATGSNFQFLVAPEHVQRRQAALNAPDTTEIDSERGVPYHVQFRFMPEGRRSSTSLWLEEHGRWWPDADGKPARARGVVRVIDERFREEQRQLYRTDHDELTGQLTRMRLTEALGAVLARSERTGNACAFLIASVNNLSVINETFGFDVGDEVITSVARLIKDKLRGGDTIGRYSSNKFGIILHDCGPGAMRIAAERFLKAVRDATIRTSACMMSATISIGGVLLGEQAQTVHQATSFALEALAKARLRRHDSFAAYVPSTVRDSVRKRNLAIADQVISALEQNRMQLALQPIVATGTREVALYECLLRMEKSDGTLVSAGEFIEVAEQLGLSRLIDKRTLELAVEVAKSKPDIRLSINVSSLTCNDPEWLVALQRLTNGQRSLAERLTIEITETAAIHDLDQSIAFVDTLKELGLRVAIDDFGAGYTSFRNLKHLAVDMVKIDGAFVKNLADDASDQLFIRTFVQLAHSFGMETVAEWVGDEATARICNEAGITYLQGYHCGRPLLVDKPLASVSTAIAV